jgi:hypothetical protein
MSKFRSNSTAKFLAWVTMLAYRDVDPDNRQFLIKSEFPMLYERLRDPHLVNFLSKGHKDILTFDESLDVSIMRCWILVYTHFKSLMGLCPDVQSLASTVIGHPSSDVFPKTSYPDDVFDPVTRVVLGLHKLTLSGTLDSEPFGYFFSKSFFRDKATVFASYLPSLEASIVAGRLSSIIVDNDPSQGLFVTLPSVSEYIDDVDKKDVRKAAYNFGFGENVSEVINHDDAILSELKRLRHKDGFEKRRLFLLKPYHPILKRVKAGNLNAMRSDLPSLPGLIKWLQFLTTSRTQLTEDDVDGMVEKLEYRVSEKIFSHIGPKKTAYLDYSFAEVQRIK